MNETNQYEYIHIITASVFAVMFYVIKN